MNALELSSVTLVRRGEKILDSVSLCVAEGEFYLLVGKDPAQLSAALGVAAGRVRPTLGAAVAFGLPAREQRGRIGGLRANNALVEALSSKTGLDRAKARLDRALGGGRKAIVLDDPWRGLSATEGQAFSQLVAQACAQEGIAALCSTTSPDVAGLFAGCYGVMDGARLVAQKTPAMLGGQRAATYKVRTTRLERDLVLLGDSLPGATITVESDPLTSEKFLLVAGCEEAVLARALDGLDSITLELSREHPSPTALLFEGLGDQA